MNSSVASGVADPMLIDRVEEFLIREGAVPVGSGIVVGVSGGVDSVSLLDILLSIGYRPHALHVNYGLRGAQSDADEALVRDTCVRLQIPLEVIHADESWQHQRGGKSLQEAARDLRYAAYEQYAMSKSLEWVSTAHHRDDQVETILMNLFRGTGPEGFLGIPAIRHIRSGSAIKIIRPLLDARRSEIVDFAISRGIAWREDASNQHPRFRRTAVRYELLPTIVRLFGETAVDGILRSADHISRVIRTGSLAAVGDQLSISEGVVNVPLDVLKADGELDPGHVILQILRRWYPTIPRSSAVVESIRCLVDSPVGKQWTHPELSVVRERESLVFLVESGAVASDTDEECMLMPGRSTPIPGGMVRVDQLAEVPADLDSGSPLLAFADGRILEHELTIGPWRAGDSIRLLGSDATKKISDLLTDEKVPHLQRKHVRVIRSQGKVVWVVGTRLSAEFSIRQNTEVAVMLSVLPEQPDGYFRS